MWRAGLDRLDAMAAFVAVADAASFATAARTLGRSATAVTRAVQGLEDQLGTRLFHRTTRAVALTDAGARQLERCRRVLAEYAAFETMADDDRREPGGRLTITAPVMFGRLHVCPIVVDFMTDHPKVTVDFLLLDRVVGLVEEGIDVGVRIGHLPDSSLRAIRVGSVRRVLLAAPDHLAHHGAPETPDALGEHPVVGIANLTGTPDRWAFAMPDGAEKTITVRPRLTVTQVEAGLAAAAAGAGITRALSYQAERMIAEGALVPILTGFEPPPIPIHVVHPAGRHLSLAARRFIDAVTNGLRRAPALTFSPDRAT